MSFSTMTTEDQEAFRHIVSREQTWGEFRFLQGLLADIEVQEWRELLVFEAWALMRSTTTATLSELAQLLAPEERLV